VQATMIKSSVDQNAVFVFLTAFSINLMAAINKDIFGLSPRKAQDAGPEQ
jgi:hypothetical protein